MAEIQTLTTVASSALPGPAERKRLGSSIWLLLLLSRWKEPTDLYVRSGASIQAQELGRALGVGERQVRRELQRLRVAGFVELKNTGRGFRIRILEHAAATGSRG